MKTLGSILVLIFSTWVLYSCSNKSIKYSYIKKYTDDSTSFSAIFDSTIHFTENRSKAWVDFSNTLKFKGSDSVFVNVSGAFLSLDSTKSQLLKISIFGKTNYHRLNYGNFEIKESFIFTEIPISAKIKFNFPELLKKSEDEAWVNNIDITNIPK